MKTTTTLLMLALFASTAACSAAVGPEGEAKVGELGELDAGADAADERTPAVGGEDVDGINVDKNTNDAGRYASVVVGRGGVRGVR